MTSEAERLPKGDSAAAARIAAEIAVALGRMPFVRHVALFGTLAEGTADAWSDADMLVACDRCEETCWICAQGIRAAKPVILYRPFSTAPQPSGRYWFSGESPFQRLDISLQTVEDYKKRVREAAFLGHALTIREVALLAKPPDVAIGGADGAPIAFSEKDSAIGDWIVRIGNSTKAVMRGKAPATPLAVAAEGLRRAFDGAGHDAIMAGGAIGMIARQFLDMAARITDRPDALDG